MAFRSHVARDFSARYPTHRLILLIGVGIGALAVVDWLTASGSATVLLSPLHVGIVWALTREIDPDHDWTAIAGAVFAGVWALYLGPTVSVLAVAAMLLAARVMSETTGRRPLLTDLVVLGGLGVAAGYTPEGWVAGVGMAVALFLDDRRAPLRLPAQRWIALATLLGATTVAWVSDVTIPTDVRGGLSLAAAVGAFLLIIRPPEEPVAVADARHATPLHRARIHMSRSITGIVIYGMAVMAGTEDAEGTVPLLAVMALIVASNEIERVSRS
jgi:hypothetical protein